MQQTEFYLTTSEVGARLRRSTYSVRRYLRRGDLKGILLKRRWLIPQKELDRLLGKNPPPVSQELHDG